MSSARARNVGRLEEVGMREGAERDAASVCIGGADRSGGEDWRGKKSEELFDFLCAGVRDPSVVSPLLIQ